MILGRLVLCSRLASEYFTALAQDEVTGISNDCHSCYSRISNIPDRKQYFLLLIPSLYIEDVSGVAPRSRS